MTFADVRSAVFATIPLIPQNLFSASPLSPHCVQLQQLSCIHCVMAEGLVRRKRLLVL